MREAEESADLETLDINDFRNYFEIIPDNS